MAKKISRTPRKKDDSQAALEVTDGLDHPAFEQEGPASHSTLEAATVSSSLSTFWKTFRLSPIEREHKWLTDMRWLTLIMFGPLALLVILWTLYVIVYYKSIGQPPLMQYAFSDLRDPIFTVISLSLFFGALTFCYRWYPNVRDAFESLLDNDLLRDQAGNPIKTADFLTFLEEYRRRLNSRKRYILPTIFILITLIASFFITISRGGYWTLDKLNQPLYLLDFLHLLPRWILAPMLWSYIGMLWLWALVVTTRTIMDLTPQFQINVQPLHSDRAGGLKKLGDLCSYVGLMITVTATPSLVLALQGTYISTQIIPCGNDIQQFVVGQSNLTPERLTQCIHYNEYFRFSYADISDYITKQLNSGNTLQSIASDYYSRNATLFDRHTIIGRYSIYYAMDLVLAIILCFAFYVVIRPLVDIHNSMVEYKQKRERETNQKISKLFNELTDLIKQDKFQEADHVKANIKFLHAELSEIQNYPRWPISYPLVLRSYLTSSFVTALITYVLSLLKLSISADAGRFLTEAIKATFGQ